MRLRRFLVLPVILLVSVMASCNFDGTGKGNRNTEVTSLRTRNLVNPEGVDKAVFSWKIESGELGVLQNAYEIEIASSEKALEKGSADVWRSGKMISDEQLFVEPKVSLKYGDLYWWRVRVWDGNDKVTGWSVPARFSIGPAPGDWKAKWITSKWTADSPMPYFRKVFDASTGGKKPVRAVIYFSGLGYGDLWFNGELVDETRVLDPGQTNYEQFAFYTTFDVTPQLLKNENCIGVMLGEGFYAQGRVWGPGFKYGDPVMSLQMELIYEDGSRKVIVSDESWQWSPGPVLYANVYAGEIYDANKEIKGWSEPKTAVEGWKNAEIASSGVIPAQLRPQVMEPIRYQQEIPAVDMWQDPQGNWIFDFGVNIAGVPRITISQPQGTRLKMRMGEALNDDRSVDYSTTGVFATGVIQTDEYICTGKGTEIWTPRFTYHGYRYLEFSGSTTKPELSWIKTVLVHNDLDRRGEFECADPQINRLHELAVRTMLANTHSIPTDCPHRERCGWLGDAHAVAPFENLNFNMYNFWMKYLLDIASTSSRFEKNTLHQKLHNNQFYFTDKQPGIPHMIAPGRRLCGVASPDWGTAVVQIPWYTYLYYGNKEPLEMYYETMKQWVDHTNYLTYHPIDIETTPDIVAYGLGDWCPPGGNRQIDCPISLSSTAFHYNDARLVARTAELLGKTADVKRYNEMKERIAAAFIEKFYDKANKTFGSQTANTMALDFGLVPEGDEKAVSDAIVRNMKEERHNFIHTGIFGLGRVGQALSRYGNGSQAWAAFTKKGENSFAYMWDNADATSLWETLPISSQSMEKGRKASLNHPMQGVYDAWFYEDIAGIRPDESGAGFKVIRFEPTVTDMLPWAKAAIDTPYGKAVSDWSNEGGKLTWKITIPANTSGIVALPDDKMITVNGEAPAFVASGHKDGKKLYNFPSGNYLVIVE
ncbi:MAG: glycoside hydrolase family 78 protein [Bacteroidales bacterium]|jgi:alpha-L-rhamnosidase|nr:glycoside hydrolase family 78 protein [Bacteroidales bacterium]